MKTYLFKALILTLISSCIITFLLIGIMLSTRPVDHNRMRCDMSGILYGVGIALDILLTISAFPIFLNLNKKVRENYYYSLTSFFLVPLIIIIGFGLVEGTGIIISIPFIIVLTFFFIKFRKSKFVEIKKEL